jgi:hypothetical protein
MPRIVYLSVPSQPNFQVRHTPAFLSHEELQQHGVTNHSGFNIFRAAASARGTSEAQVLVALNETRRRFLDFARCCSKFDRPLSILWKLIRFRRFVRSETRRSRLKWHLAWAHLWWLEQRAGPVMTLEVAS